MEDVTDVNSSGVLPGRLPLPVLQENFLDASPPLTALQAATEAERCLYCFDAPCVTACPTAIDIPTFIQRIAQDNLRGAAESILSANPLGGTCARACPTETLCEQACVRCAADQAPVAIGQLQRYATDAFFSQAEAPPLFMRKPATGRQVAVVGAGPAGLSVSHYLARLGHQVELFDSRNKLGGLNEYGLAAYKMTGDFASREVDWLLSIGGIAARCNHRLGRDLSLSQLVAEYDAVFLGLGLQAVKPLVLTGEGAGPVMDAVDFIAELRQAERLDQIAVGRSVVIVGGGMTAVDAAVQCRKLGAREVTILYRRGPSQLSASLEELRWAQINGVNIRCWATPKSLRGEQGQLHAVRCAVTAERGGQLVETGEYFELAADLLIKAVGQQLGPDDLEGLVLQDGRILTDFEGHTSHPRVWAGGDCRYGSRDLTVEAVEHGKRAAFAIDAYLTGA